MTDLAPQPQAFALIEQRIDAVGRRYRLQRIIRGIMLWSTAAILSSVAVAFAAHFLREGGRTFALAVVWIVWLLASAGVWIVWPMLRRPGRVEMARLVEQRVDGLHNGLTNSLLLANAPDLAASPFLNPIFNEILHTTDAQPIASAVSWSRLKPLATRLGMIAAVPVLIALLFHAQFAHGMRQMLAPDHFVPQVGAMQITDIQPGDVTLIAGQPLELSATASGPLDSDAKLIFAGSPAALLTPTRQDDGTLHYSYRVDHIDQSTRYRLEVGSSQSRWFNVTVVQQVRLTELDFTITPPAYTALPAQTISLKPDDLPKAALMIPQGSVVQIAAAIDTPVDKAMLQLGDTRQLDMQAGDGNRRFLQSLTLMADTPLSLALLQGQQIIAKFPDDPLVLHCKADDPPRIDMRWPNQDGVTIPPTRDLTVEASITDDYGLTAARVFMAPGDATPTLAVEQPNAASLGKTLDLKLPIHLTADQARDGQSIHVQVEAVDNRSLVAEFKSAGITTDDGGPHTVRGPLLEIKFVDPSRLAAEQKDRVDKLHARLVEMLKKQQDLLAQAVAFTAPQLDAMKAINAGQTDLRAMMTDTADHFTFDQDTAIVQRALQMLAVNPAREAIDLSQAIVAEPVPAQRMKLADSLRAQQQHIITTLQSLLAMLNPAQDLAATQPEETNKPLLSKADAYKKLDEALKEYIKEQQHILDQTASLAKKPVDNFDDADKKKLADLKLAQENLDAFMQQKIVDFSKNAEQDMSNADLLKELFEIQSETTMAKNALNQQATEIAVAAEDNGLELAKEQQSNIEKWLGNTPDRAQWTQEDPLKHTDTPMPELPAQLEDMMGQLLEQQEDLFQQMEDQNANWQDSADKGIGWDAADGPIADMSAKGITGNTLPNNNEMQGRSGEGRNGMSQGEFVGDSAIGKGGRNTPSRLDPTPFQKGQINDTSKDPVGGATGGGKISGEGGQGLEGPVPPQVSQQMKRLAQAQAQLRNNAERLNLQYQLGRYDNFKLLQSIALMRRVESDLNANRYDNALRRRDQLIDSLDASKMLLGAQLHVEQDTTPSPTGKTQQDIANAMKGDLPPAWSDALKQYYQKLGSE